MFGWALRVGLLGHEIEFAWRLKSTPIETIAHSAVSLGGQLPVRQLLDDDYAVEPVEPSRTPALEYLISSMYK